MRYRFLPFLLFQTRPKRNGVKTGHASCPPKFLDCARFREIFDCTGRGTWLSMPRSVLASCSLNETINVFSRSTALVRRLGPIPIRRWRLLLLQLLSLLFVLLLQLLRLLLVLLLHLLLCCFTGVLLRQPLMFLLLLLLEFLPFLFLLREYLFLLLLVLLVQLRVACVWGAGSRRGRKVARMDRRAGSGSIVVWTRCRAIRFSPFLQGRRGAGAGLRLAPARLGARLKNEFHRLENRHFRGCGKSVRLCTLFEDSL